MYFVGGSLVVVADGREADAEVGAELVKDHHAQQNQKIAPVRVLLEAELAGEKQRERVSACTASTQRIATDDITLSLTRPLDRSYLVDHLLAARQRARHRSVAEIRSIAERQCGVGSGVGSGGEECGGGGGGVASNVEVVGSSVPIVDHRLVVAEAREQVRVEEAVRGVDDVGGGVDESGVDGGHAGQVGEAGGCERECRARVS